mgnify:CR=1 FL=1
MASNNYPYDMHVFFIDEKRLTSYSLDSINNVLENMTNRIAGERWANPSTPNFHQQCKRDLYNIYQDALQEGHAQLVRKDYIVTISVDKKHKMVQFDVLFHKENTKQLNLVMTVNGPVQK